MLIHWGKAAKGDAQGKAQVIGRWLGIKFFDVLGEGGTFRAVDCLVGPLLSLTPGRWTWADKLNGGLSVKLPYGKC